MSKAAIDILVIEYGEACKELSIAQGLVRRRRQDLQAICPHEFIVEVAFAGKFCELCRKDMTFGRES